ncbi:MAG: MarR family winged helix-turn-helix transcriptional regulator [Stellaceae bacterium]
MTPDGFRVVDRESALDHDDKLELKLWLRLLTCTNLIEAQVRNLLRAHFDTSLPRFDLLAQLDRAPDGLAMGELSSRLMVSGGNVTGLVEALRREGMVARKAHPADRRSQIIRLTAKGRRFFDAMAPVHEAWIDRLFGRMTHAELDELFRLLGQLKLSAHRRGETP